MENINQREENESGENVGLLVLEPKSFRPFKTKDEYLYAMKEDLAEWFKCLYEGKKITADNFLDVLETGVLLCQHANKVRQFATEQRAKGEFEVKSNFVRDIQIPEYDVQFRIDVKPGTFLARDNISNFITWTTKMRIPEVLRFETDDLVMRKNERSVVLCLLEVARVGAKFGMLAPTIVQMEEEIDNEIETGKPPPQIKTCDVKSLDEMVRELVGRCTCPVQFPIIKVGDGKYKIGDNQTLVFVRILRKHVMIRVGGGWDTLEHYLDRHDPCRCGFQGHRGGRAPSVRRPSTASLSQSLPSTPKTSRKMYVTTTSNNMNPVTSSRPASPCMRSASPGPSSRKKDITVQNSSLQPGVSTSSPGTTNKQLTFSGTKLNTYSKQKSVSNSGLSHSGSVGSFVKQSHAYISRQNSSDSQPRTTQKRSSSPALRPQSPASRRSESPEPVVANRLRSPSPSIQIDTKTSRTQSAPATNTDRCVSPIKQITLSELRSSREVKLTQQPSQIQQNQKQSLKRQFSTNEKETTMESDSKTHSLTIDKISTMSLGDFKNLLNSALSVPSGASESLCSSDSPRSQSSIESLRTSSMKTNITNKAAEYRSPYSYKPVCTNTNSGNKSSSIASPNKENNVKSNLGCSSSGYSNSLTSHKTIKSNLNSSKQSANLKKTDARPRTSPSGLKNGIISNKLTNSQSLSNSNVRKTYSNTSLHGTDYSRPKTPTSMGRSRSDISSVNDTANTVHYASLSSSNNSLKSCESVDERHSEVVIESYKQPDEVSLTLSSLTSDNLLQSFESKHSVSVGHIRSNSYTQCDEADDKTACDNLNINTRAASEPRVTVPNDYTNGYSAVEGKPLNVGYAYMFSYQSENNDTNDSIERSELEISEKKQNDGQSVVSTGRPSTPSFIPRPLTPKGSKKLTLPQNNDSNTGLKHEEKKSTARPPTPRKSNIIARSPGVRSSDSSKEQSYKAIFQKRSMTPCTESNLSNISSTSVRRSSTPGPYLQKAVTLNATSFATTRTRQHGNIKQIHNGKDMALSVYSERNINSQSQDTISSLGRQRSQSMDRRLTRQKSTDETVIMVNRSGGQHTVTLQNDTESRSNVHKNKVLARARTEDSRARSQAKTSGTTRQRPQSVEPRQLIPRQKTHNEQGGLAAKRGDNGQHSVYDRTQKWVQTAVEQTKAKTTNVSTKVRRSMTPNSFDIKIDSGVEEPRSLEEIKMALSLPINGLNSINPEQLEAPPEDPEMYATMEKLFHELRQQELKASVNETPGSNMNGSKSSKSKSDSSINDEALSLDSNKNVKRKQVSDSTNCKSNVTSPTLSRPNIISAVSSQNNCTKSKPSSRTSSTSSAGVASNSSSTPAKVNYPASSRATQHIPVSMPSSRVVSSSTLSSPQAQTYTERPQSPGTTPVSIQRPQSPGTTPVSIQRPQSPGTTPVSIQRPQSPGTTPVSIQRPQSPGTAPVSIQRPQSPGTTPVSIQRPQSPRTTPVSIQRPQSPRTTPVSIQRPQSPRTTPVSIQRPQSPRTTPVSIQRPQSPRTTPVSIQRPQSPRTTTVLIQRSQSPRTTPVSIQRPPSACVTSSSTRRPLSPRASSPKTSLDTKQSSRPASPVNKQPPRPSSTPPRSFSLISNPRSKSYDDSDYESVQKNTGSLISKLKEIIKVKPRKDKGGIAKPKSKIPAPKSLASTGKSRSFTNLSELSNTMSLAHSEINSYTLTEPELNGYEEINCGLNVTMSGRSGSETPAPKLNKPLTTGRSSLIRKESMDKNKSATVHKISRAMSVEQNMNSLQYFDNYDEGELV